MEDKSVLNPIDYDELIINNDKHKSWLIKVDGEEFWFPKKCCELDKEQNIIYAPLWLCERLKLL